MSVLTVTLNVAIDQTVLLGRQGALRPGQVHRAESVHYNAGGKGVNVSSCLADWHIPTMAAGFIGTRNAPIFDELFRKKGIEDHFLRLPGLSRTNIKLVDANDTTDINLPGFSVDTADLDRLDAVLDAILNNNPGIAVLAGSLPAGCPESIYTHMTSRATSAGHKVIVDTAGPALHHLLHSRNLPFCIKPNKAELAEFTGVQRDTLEDLTHDALTLHRRGIALVVVSLGSEGALFVSAEGAVLAQGSVDDLVSTVGAGDAMVAGIAAALYENDSLEKGSLERMARLGTAFSISKLRLAGPNLPEHALVEAAAAKVSIRRIHSD